GSDTLTLSNFITVYTNPFAPIISQVGNTLTSTPATSYQWQLNSVDIPGATNQSYTITQSGLYTVIIGDDNGCTAQASVDASYVGIEEVGTTCFVNVYSNPATDALMVEFLFAGSNGFAGNEITISIFNALGQKVFSSEEKIISGKMKIDISNIVAGIYFLQLQTGASTTVRKFVKE
ncbi:MAG TPA: T9SS type A sorting domain-containing protein, partial [Chitinophagales bacterium]|nr:T9SS type A sorting domain-containing protein [Chitinophagales bacterium]